MVNVCLLFDNPIEGCLRYTRVSTFNTANSGSYSPDLDYRCHYIDSTNYYPLYDMSKGQITEYAIPYKSQESVIRPTVLLYYGY